MAVFRHSTYGKGGGLAWLLLVRPFALTLLVVSLPVVLFDLDFSGYGAVLAILLASYFFLVYLLVGSIQMLLEAPRVAQTIHVNGDIHVRFYFGRRISFAPEAVVGVMPHRLNHWTRFHSLLEFGKDNYIVRLSNGSWFYVSAGLDRAVELTDKLRATEQ